MCETREEREQQVVLAAFQRESIRRHDEEARKLGQLLASAGRMEISRDPARRIVTVRAYMEVTQELLEAME